MDKKLLKGTQTEKNLMSAFIGESIARNKYTMFSGIAHKEGYEQIAQIFLNTAENERQHGKIFYKFMEGSELKGLGEFIHCYGNTLENLKCAAEGENEEATLLYPNAADTADEEGFYDIAMAFRNISKIESHHHARYKKLAENIENHLVFSRPEDEYWICMKCGFIVLGKEAPEVCPVCHHPQGYYELLCDNF